MKMSDVFPSNYLKADDLPPGAVAKAKIDRVEMEELGQGKDRETKPVMYFIGKEKGLVMNKTNWQTVSDVYGDESDEWHNKVIGIARDRTTFGGKSVECVRLRVVTNGDGGGNPSAGGQHQGAAAAFAARREAIAARDPAPQPFNEEGTFSPDDIPF